MIYLKSKDYKLLLLVMLMIIHIASKLLLPQAIQKSQKAIENPISLKALKKQVITHKNLSKNRTKRL